MATISVIIPVYNIENYLNQCLNSIIGQTYTDIEIIIVDDGSTDSSPDICDEYAKSDSRIRVIHKKNGGVVSARKAGAKVAASDYVVCVDGDDWIEKEYCEKFALVIEKYVPDMICCGRITQSKNKTSYKEKVKENCGYYTRENMEKAIFPHLIEFSNCITSKAFKRDLYLDIQMSLDDRIKMAEDACVVVPCAYKSESIYIMEDCLYNYRYNSSSMTNSKSVYSLEEPKLIAGHFMKHIDFEDESLKGQLYRSTAHRLFNRCISRFYQHKPYREVCKELAVSLDDDFYRKCINECSIPITVSYKEWLASWALKKRCYPAMKIYSMVRRII